MEMLRKCLVAFDAIQAVGKMLLKYSQTQLKNKINATKNQMWITKISLLYGKTFAQVLVIPVFIYYLLDYISSSKCLTTTTLDMIVDKPTF